jgi:hypothetical protein
MGGMLSAGGSVSVRCLRTQNKHNTQVIAHASDNNVHIRYMCLRLQRLHWRQHDNASAVAALQLSLNSQSADHSRQDHGTHRKVLLRTLLSLSSC